MERNKKNIAALASSTSILSQLKLDEIPKEHDLSKLLDIRTLEIRSLNNTGQFYLDPVTGMELSSKLIPFCLRRSNFNISSSNNQEDKNTLVLCIALAITLLEYYDHGRNEAVAHDAVDVLVEEDCSHIEEDDQDAAKKMCCSKTAADVEKIQRLVTIGCHFGVFDGVTEISRTAALIQSIQHFLSTVKEMADPMECVGIVRPLLFLEGLRSACSSVKLSIIELLKTLGAVLPTLQDADASLLLSFLTGCLETSKIAMESMTCIIKCNARCSAFSGEFHQFLKSPKASRLLVWLDSPSLPTFPLVNQAIQQSFDVFGKEIIAALFETISLAMEQYKRKRDDNALLRLLKSLKGLAGINALGAHEAVSFLEILKEFVVNPNAVPKIQQYWSVPHQCPDFVESVEVNHHIISLLETLKPHFDGKRMLMLLQQDLNILKMPEYRGSKGYGLMFVNEVCLAISREQRDGSWADEEASKKAISVLLEVLKSNMEVLVDYNLHEVEDGYLKTHWSAGINKLILRSFSHIGLILMENCDIWNSQTARKAILSTLTFTQREVHATSLADGPSGPPVPKSPIITTDVCELQPPPGLSSWSCFEDAMISSDWVTGTTTVHLANKALNTLANLVQPGTSFEDLLIEFEDELYKLLECLKGLKWKEDVGYVQALVLIIKQIQYCMGGEVFGLCLSLILPVVDDYEPKYQTLGLAMLLRAMRMTTPTEISWNKVVIMEVLNRSLTGCRDNARAIRYCLACMALAEPSVQECNGIIDNIMRALSLMPSPTVTVAYLDGIVEIFQRLPSGFHLVEHLGALSGTLLPLLQLGNLAQKQAVVRCLHFFVLACWPRLNQHKYAVAVSLLECCCSERNADCADENLIGNCINLLVIISYICGESLEIFLEKAKQNIKRPIEDIFEKVSLVSSQMKETYGSTLPLKQISDLSGT